MAYNGRAVLERGAVEHGWTTISVTLCSGEREQAIYGRDGVTVLVVWTPQNSATYIAKNFGMPDEVSADGPLGLVSARNWMEEIR